jgi:hypothetical protein
MQISADPRKCGISGHRSRQREQIALRLRQIEGPAERTPANLSIGGILRFGNQPRKLDRLAVGLVELSLVRRQSGGLGQKAVGLVVGDGTAFGRGLRRPKHAQP